MELSGFSLAFLELVFLYSHSASGGGGGFQKPFVEKTTEKPKKAPRTRPKLTPELLLSDNGLGYVLRHFPRSFKFRGRGHEVSDLGNLIGLYTQWHSRLLPYYSFDQFVQKVERVGATRRVRTCIRDLRERVANGGDPSKLHEPPVEHNEPNFEPEEANNLEAGPPSHDMGDPVLESHDNVDMQEEMLDEVYKEATAEPCESSQRPMPAEPQVLSESISSMSKSPNPVSDNGAGSSSIVQITDEQKARMEANRLKALERAAARASSSQAA
ncbi:Replication fork protection component Swi3 [Macleaya cordata]|uniref:Replication fork protection component Swi3 n=1 Tax=Macleaya cordata TaxID=56857 RepID=A0A200PSJ3_MACCD|nr:Replication fork protection component Swi3 [Macleaya cordata]